jgi:hypothetical protein
VKVCARPLCNNPVRSNHPQALYCSHAHRQEAWKEKHGYRLYGRKKASQRRRSREGQGVRPYLSTDEALELLKLPIPASVRAKLESKLKPADPLPGQLDIVTELAKENEHAAG